MWRGRSASIAVCSARWGASCGRCRGAQGQVWGVGCTRGVAGRHPSPSAALGEADPAAVRYTSRRWGRKHVGLGSSWQAGAAEVRGVDTGGCERGHPQR
eukprot:305814-Chlamydomonas_euryale.AAC.3